MSVEPGSTQDGQILANGSVIDDIRLGDPVACPATDPECETRLTLARDAVIDRHGLAPSAIGEAHFYTTYLAPGAAYGSGGGLIVIFDLADGSQAAVHTVCFDGCFVVGSQPDQAPTLEPARDHGPLVDPPVEAPVDCASTDHPTCNEAVRVAIAAATDRGLIAPSTIANGHYYVIDVPAEAPAAATTREGYIVDLYIAGAHDVLAEASVEISCVSGGCHVVSYRDTT